MDFSELYKQSNSLCTFSPDGKYLATAVQYRVVVRDSETLQIAHLFTCLDLVQAIDWSADSRLLLCASYKLGAVNIWSLDDASWSAKIDEGAGGLTAVRFAPDGRHVLCFSDFQLRITIWSLITKEAVYIQYPKHSDKAFHFRKDYRYLVVAERKDCKDHVSVYDCEDWTLLKHFPVNTVDLEDLAWSPDGRFIAVWDSNLDYRMLIYSPDGRCLSTYSAYENGLGIKSVAWSPSSQFLAIGSYDQKVRLLNHYTWSPIIDFSHPSVINTPDATVYKEIDIRTNGTGGSLMNNGPRPKLSYEVVPQPFTVTATKPDPDKPNPKLGVGILQFNADGRYLATRNDNMAQTLWIWDIINLSLIAVVNQLSTIRSVKWNPVYPDRLALCTGNGFIYLWSGKDEGCNCVEVPALNFQVNNFRWSRDGKSLLLLDKDTFCTSYFVDT